MRNRPHVPTGCHQWIIHVLHQNGPNVGKCTWHGWYRPDLACSGTSWWGRWPDSSHPGQLARYGLKMNQNLQHHSCKDEITYIHKMLQYISNISTYCDNENLLDLYTYVIICTSWKECICDMCCSSQKAIQQPIHALRNQVVATVKQIE